MEKNQIIIVGAGMVGLICALSLAQKNYRVTLVEAKPLAFQADEKNPRVSAINCASLEMLKNTGIFERIAEPHRSPLLKMEVWDDKGGGQIQFDSADLNLPELGFIIHNQAILRAAWELIKRNENITFINQAPIKIQREASQIILEFSEDHTISGELLIGADGSNSWVRENAGIEAEISPYEQSGIVAIIETELAHRNCAFQNFLSTGPLGALPLSHPQQLSIVWSADTEYANQLLSMEVEAFNAALQSALGNKLGAAKLISDRQEFPLKALHAKKYCEERLVLIGDAAHTIHPLAGQGVNLGLMDAIVLIDNLDEALKKHREIGAFRVLRAYERARKLDNCAMLASMSGFKMLFGNQNSWLIQLRSLGFNAVNKCGPLKKFFMRKACGT